MPRQLPLGTHRASPDAIVPAPRWFMTVLRVMTTELQRRVLSFLDGQSLARCEAVCHDINVPAADNATWSAALHAHFLPAITG